MALEDAADGELRVLAEGVEGPAVALEHHLAAEEVSGAGDHRAQTQLGPGGVEEGGVPQEPKAVASGDPVVAEIFGVPVAGNDLAVRGEGLVHPGDVVRGQEVVGVKDKVAVKVVVPPGIPDLGQEVVEGVALAHVDPVRALVDHGPGLPCRPGGAVGAVVRHHESDEAVRRVVLAADAVQQVADHRLLVSGGDEHRVAADGGRRLGPLPAQKSDRDIEKLVGVAQKEEDADDPVDAAQNNQSAHVSLLSRARQMAR